MIDLKLWHWWACSSKTKQNKTKQNKTKITKFESWFEINHKKHIIKVIAHAKIKINMISSFTYARMCSLHCLALKWAATQLDAILKQLRTMHQLKDLHFITTLLELKAHFHYFFVLSHSIFLLCNWCYLWFFSTCTFAEQPKKNVNETSISGI